MAEFTRRNWLSSAAMAGLAITGPAGLALAGSNVGSPRRHPEAGSLHSHDVIAFGADGGGHSDATEAFQKALDAAHHDGGGIVHVPAGQYLIAGSLDVPPYTALEGVSRGPTSHAYLANPAVGGSVLLATGGKGNQDATPLISMAENSAVLGLCLFHPHQNRNSTPVAYPWAISMKGNNCTVENVELLNSWYGIRAVRAARHLIRNVTGQPLKIGILVDEVTDVGRIENVHFNPWWSNNHAVLEFMYRHGESFVFGRSDQQYVLNTFSYGYHVGYRFIEGKNGVCYGSFLGIGADGSWHACVVEQSSFLLITNGEFVAYDWLKLGDEVDMVGVVVKSTNRGPVRFVNSAFWGPGQRAIARLEGPSTLGFGQCTFNEWNHHLAAIDAASGNVFVTGCEFRQNSPQIELGAAVRQAVITGNMANGPWRINNAIAHRAQIGFNSSVS